MEKTVFTNSLNNLMNTIKLTYDHIDALKETYISINKKFNIGEKVKIIIPESKSYSGTIDPEQIKFGFISNIYINYANDIDYHCNKMKKDGTISEHQERIHNNYIITKY